MTSPIVTARAIIEQVAVENGMTVEDMYRRSRKAYIVEARICAMRRIRKMTDLKLVMIARLFGLHHSTVSEHLRINGARDTAAGKANGIAGVI